MYLGCTHLTLTKKREWTKISLIWSAFVSTLREGNYCSSGKKIHWFKCDRIQLLALRIGRNIYMYTRCSVSTRLFLYVVRAQMACKEIFYKKKAKHVPVYMCHEVLWELRLGHQDRLSLYRNNLRVWAGLFTDRLKLVTVVEILLLISFQSYVIFTTQHQPSFI